MPLRASHLGSNDGISLRGAYKLKPVDPARACSLSSFAYVKTIAMLKEASFRPGLDPIEMDPAYASVIAAVHCACRHGTCSHQSAVWSSRPGRVEPILTARPFERPSCRPALDGSSSPLPCLRGTGRSMCGGSGRLFEGVSQPWMGGQEVIE
ncbi:hypothetical protein [Candidatus Methylacidithermus pantelleriae]|uniref:Uncharacterized protein n=1 Tax=Candidatus Methylacidithermus pantelleriae TaxID=2744239 RepID=A0A8J2FW90_9BACT|nr:hypothetical protein [Candidatus Methylacidithermus pantelleriae]CAF0697990.1 hypothetical protein MPNT_240006 [Candidatus Methylacidithermus pantelleriae]